VCSVSALTCVFPIYLVCRAAYWALFRSKRKELSSPKIEIFSDAKKPTEFQGVKNIDEVQHKIVWRIPLHQGQARGILFTVASIPALTIISVALRGLIGFTDGFAIGLLFGESFYLAVLLWFVISDRGPTVKWLAGRTQAELLRREQYLCLGGLGIYREAANVENSVVSRLAKLDTEDFSELKKLIPIGEMRTQGAPSSPVDIKTLQEHLATYIKYRIQKQIFHMQWALEDAEKTNSLLTRILAFSAILALISAVAHSVVDPIPVKSLPGVPSIQLTNVFLIVSAIATGFAAFAIAISNLLKLEQLSRLYAWVIVELRRKLEDALKLHTEIKDSNSGLNSVRELIFDVESILTSELLQFLLVSEKSHSLG
jgi:hypothetical protein